jgi:glutathione synthase/RimK-type ligase-like ATP-grasp enzyme
MVIGVATCSDLPGWEIDDQPLFDVMKRQGVTYSLVEWDDPAVDWASFEGILVRTTWDYTEYYRDFLQWIRDVSAITPIFNPPETLLWNAHKSYLRDLEERGVPIAPTVWLERGQYVDIAQIFSQTGWSSGFVKPLVGATARGTMRFRADERGLANAQKHLDELLGVCGAMVQPYLSSVETEGEYSAIIIDGEVTHTVRKVPVAGDYRVQDDHGASDEPCVLSEEELELCHRVCKLVSNSPDWHGKWSGQPLLYARVDLLRDADGKFVLNELELVEPSLFLRHGPQAAGKLVKALQRRLQS